MQFSACYQLYKGKYLLWTKLGAYTGVKLIILSQKKFVINQIVEFKSGHI